VLGGSAAFQEKADVGVFRPAVQKARIRLREWKYSAAHGDEFASVSSFL
jgi:hypothetical protein